jgi:hypothetical protein
MLNLCASILISAHNSARIERHGRSVQREDCPMEPSTKWLILSRVWAGRAPVHQGEPHRPCLLEPFPPSVKAVLRQALFLTELLHGNSGALLRCDSFGPLLCFWVGGPMLDDGVAHDTTMQHQPADQEERFTRFTRRLRNPDPLGPDHLCTGRQFHRGIRFCVERQAFVAHEVLVVR